MKAFLVLLLVAAASARPQPQAETTVTCERRDTGSGKFEFVCNADPGTIVEERTLWIQTSGSDQELLIRVPNYNLQQIIRAGLISGAAGGTNVKVHVARPQVESVVEGTFEQQGQLAPNVEVSYEGITNRGEVHYGGTGEAYRALTKQISEPGAGGRY